MLSPLSCVLLFLVNVVLVTQQKSISKCFYCVLFYSQLQKELQIESLNETSLLEIAQRICKNYGPKRLRTSCDYITVAAGDLLKEWLKKVPLDSDAHEACEIIGMCSPSITTKH
ncbi:hypothetical protein DICVIV_13532 [Dictyocaulus viviparus]|uniref:Saposin B-type domain-containing protein n=1 Tax=Dictyocaulus viviparus TaxID=29172 RepID=A0A0D8XDJ1_DICVI|nr:hypothetical protein DICVIV_13532 [Dictyocaulus viviparus]